MPFYPYHCFYAYHCFQPNVRFSNLVERGRSPVSDAMAAASASSFAADRLCRDRSLSPSAAINVRDLTMERYNKHFEGNCIKSKKVFWKQLLPFLPSAAPCNVKYLKNLVLREHYFSAGDLWVTQVKNFQIFSYLCYKFSQKIKLKRCQISA